MFALKTTRLLVLLLATAASVAAVSEASARWYWRRGASGTGWYQSDSRNVYRSQGAVLPGTSATVNGVPAATAGAPRTGSLFPSSNGMFGSQQAAPAAGNQAVAPNPFNPSAPAVPGRPPGPGGMSGYPTPTPDNARYPIPSLAPTAPGAPPVNPAAPPVPGAPSTGR